MANLSVKYLGLDLRNPIIVDGSGLTEKAETIRNLEQNGDAFERVQFMKYFRGFTG